MSTFKIVMDPYYWKSALLIAQSGVARQYRNSYLGVLWLLLPPLAMMCIYTLVMPLILKSDAKSYALYLLATLPLWQFLATSLIASAHSLIQHAETLKRSMISSSIFIVADVLKHSYSYSVGFAAMAVLGLLLGLPISWHILLWPFYFLPVLVTILALCMGIAYCAPYVRDIGDAISIAMNMLIWVCAVIYPVSVLPEWAQVWMRWNPLYILLNPSIDLIYHHRIPDVIMTLKLFSVMLLSLGLGYSLYRLGRKNYVYYL